MNRPAKTTRVIEAGYRPDKSVVIGPGYRATDVRWAATGSCEGGRCDCESCGAVALSVAPPRAPFLEVTSPSAASARILCDLGLARETAAEAPSIPRNGNEVCWAPKVVTALSERVFERYVWSPYVAAWAYAPTEAARVVVGGAHSRPPFAALNRALGPQVRWLIMGGAAARR